MWQVMYPGVGRAPASPSAEYDEVWLMTRYASLAHWQATRDMSALGGNGPDYQKAIEALALRRELTLETDLRFTTASDRTLTVLNGLELNATLAIDLSELIARLKQTLTTRIHPAGRNATGRDS